MHQSCLLWEVPFSLAFLCWLVLNLFSHRLPQAGNRRRYTFFKVSRPVNRCSKFHSACFRGIFPAAVSLDLEWSNVQHTFFIELHVVTLVSLNYIDFDLGVNKSEMKHRLFVLWYLSLQSDLGTTIQGRQALLGFQGFQSGNDKVLWSSSPRCGSKTFFVKVWWSLDRSTECQWKRTIWLSTLMNQVLLWNIWGPDLVGLRLQQSPFYATACTL